MARPWSFVQTLEASPYSTPLAQRTASSSSVNRCTVMTGPKTSSWIISSSCCSPATTVGAKKVAALPDPVAAGDDLGVLRQARR